MKNTPLAPVIKNAIMGVIALTMTQSASADTALSNNTPTTSVEKCYGITKAGMNDCQTANGSCAGSAIKDKQADAFIFFPKDFVTKLSAEKNLSNHP